MRLILFVLLFAVTGVEAQESQHTQANRLKEFVRRFTGGDTTALSDIQALLASSRAQGKQAKSLSDTLFMIADALSRTDHNREVIALERLGWSHASSMNNKRRVSEHLVGIALAYFQLDEPDSTRYYLDVLMRIPPSEWSDYTKISVSNLFGLTAKQNGKYLEAIEHYWNALEMDEGTAKQKADIHINLANLFHELKHYQRSISYSKQALVFYQQQNDTPSLSRIHTNLGVCYMRIDSLDQAGYHHQESINLSKPNTFGFARGLSNYGNVLRRQGLLHKALAAIDSSANICRRLDIPFGVGLNQINRAHVLLDMKKPVEAIGQLRASETFAPVAQAFKSEICSLSYAAYKTLGDQAAAYKYLQQYTSIKDSLEKSGSARLVLDWEEQIIRTKKDAELEALNRQLEETRNRQRLMLVAGCMLLLLAAAGIRIFLLRRRQEQLQVRLTEEAHENMKLQLEIKERELTAQAVHLQALGSFTDEMGSKLSDFKTALGGDQAEALGKIIREFQQGVPDEIWEDFRKRFDYVHDHFHHQLLQICPELTPVELRIASYLRLNLSSKEISRLTNRSAGTISNTRSALRKKLGLQEEDNLVAFLMAQ